MKSYKVIVSPFILLFAALSCTNTPSRNTKEVSSLQVEKAISNDTTLAIPKVTSNAQFRKEILPQITNEKDLKRFDTLLNVLDKRNISFCQFIESLLALDDSCYAIAKQKFPDPYQQAEFTAVHDKAIEIAEARYLKSLKMSSSLSTFAIVAYSFDKKIKGFCGK